MSTTAILVHKILFPIPGMRHFPTYITRLREQWVALYGDAGREPFTVGTYERHVAWLKRVVPEEQLVFFDVRDGWEPLCEALGKRVPVGVELPRINDGEAIERLARRMVRWGVVGGMVGVAIVG